MTEQKSRPPRPAQQRQQSRREQLGLPRSKNGSYAGRPPGAAGRRHDAADRAFFEEWGDLIDEAPGPTWHLLGRSKSLRDPRAKDPRIDPRGPVKRLKARWKRDGREIWQAAELRKRRREELQTVINALDDEDRRWLADELMSYSSWLAP